MIKDLEYDRNFDKAAAGFERIVYKLEVLLRVKSLWNSIML